MFKIWLFAAVDLVLGVALSGQQLDLQPPSSSLSYSPPRTFSVGSKSTVFQGQFQCGSDGSIFFQGYETYLDDLGVFKLESLSPSGDAFSFNPVAPPVGHKAYSSPFSYFVSNSRVLTLVTADKVDAMDRSRKLGFSRFILEYDYKGNFLKSIALEPGPTILAIAGFDSGDILLVTQDTFSKNVNLIVVDGSGASQSELKLFDNDYLGMIRGGDKQEPLPDGDQILGRMLSNAQYVPYGKNLLVVPVGTSLPILEVNERGVIRSVSLNLPKGEVIGSMLPTTGLNWMIMVATTKNSAAGSSSDGSVTISTHEIQEFDPTEGNPVRRIDVTKGLYPVCQYNGDFLFLTTRPEDGHLQSLKGSFSR